MGNIAGWHWSWWPIPWTMSWRHDKLMILKKKTLLIVWQHCISDDAKSRGGGKGGGCGGRSIYGLTSLSSELREETNISRTCALLFINQQTTSEDAMRLSCATRISNSAQQDLSHSFQTPCPAHYSPWLVTGICRKLVFYIRIMYVKKFPCSSSIETIPMLFPPNQKYFFLQFL